MSCLALYSKMSKVLIWLSVTVNNNYSRLHEDSVRLFLTGREKHHLKKLTDLSSLFVLFRIWGLEGIKIYLIKSLLFENWTCFCWVKRSLRLPQYRLKYWKLLKIFLGHSFEKGDKKVSFRINSLI